MTVKDEKIEIEDTEILKKKKKPKKAATKKKAALKEKDEANEEVSAGK